MRIHREGTGTLLVSGITLLLLNLAIGYRIPQALWLVLPISVGLYVFLLQFFRNPDRAIGETDDRLIYAPADGKICVIEETEESEFLHTPCIQVSIFMSPLNVHVNRNPVSGRIAYFTYHPGKYLVAWHPKSSTDNERTSIVYDTGTYRIMMRQIAGAVARRIKWYVFENKTVRQGDEMGFIKFGSRVDLFLPLSAEILVTMDQQVRGNRTVIARMPQ